MRIPSLALAIAIVAACSHPAAPPAPAPAPAAPAELTAKACEAAGGKVIGDIGDGAIHRPDYRCPGTGAPPSGAIVAEPGGPIASEGAVCCK